MKFFIFFPYICSQNISYRMKKSSFFYRVYDLYVDGFRNMKLGKTLWAIILIKLFIMFFILKLFFFPDFLKNKAVDGDKAGYVSTEMVERADVTHK